MKEIYSFGSYAAENPGAGLKCLLVKGYKLLLMFI